MTAETTDEPAPPAGDEPGETPTVDIHKVKPVHSWREFWGEVGIIVIGVLIALAGEQVVEAVHWHVKKVEAHRALEEELKAIFFETAERIAQTPCLNAARQAGAAGASVRRYPRSCPDERWAADSHDVPSFYPPMG